MPKVTVQKTSNIAADDAFNRVKTLLSNDKDLKKLDPSFACQFDDSTHTGTAKGNMFKADMKVQKKDAGCHVQIVVDLPLAAFPFKGMVEKTLQKKLDETLSS